MYIYICICIYIIYMYIYYMYILYIYIYIYILYLITMGFIHVGVTGLTGAKEYAQKRVILNVFDVWLTQPAI